MKTFMADGECYSTSLQKALVKLPHIEVATFTFVQNSRPLTGAFLTSVYTSRSLFEIILLRSNTAKGLTASRVLSAQGTWF